MTTFSSLNSRRSPDNLVISTREVIKPLLKYVQAYGMQEGNILHQLVQSLAVEQDAEAELSFLCIAPLEERLHDPNDVTDGELFLPTEAMAEYSNVLHRLGQHLYRELRRHRMYQLGYLPYHYHSRHCGDLVLTRLMVPEIDPPKYKTPDRFDLEDFYHRLEIFR
jgi:hypothetical protein